MQTIAERINEVLRVRGVGKSEMAQRIGVSPSSVSTMTSGKSNPSRQTIKMICKEFLVDEEWLRTGESSDGRDPFAVPAQVSLDDLAEVHFLPSDQRVLIEKFIALKPAVRQGILDYFLEVAAVVNAGKTL